GKIYQTMGKDDLARKDFDEVLKMNPTDPTNKVLCASGYLAGMPHETLKPSEAKAGDFRASKVIALLSDVVDTDYVKKDPDVVWAVAQANYRLRD
ncbi:tetratricopeptide repeat protein, partial [Escherichia coli]